MTQLRQEEIRVLEQSRQRLYQLSQSIGSLKNDVMRTNPVPAWDSLQLSASILASNLKSITDHLSKHSSLLEHVVVYPSTNFPGRTQEGLLGQLLRKKLEPGVERWVEEGRAAASSATEKDGDDSLERKWQEAKDTVGETIARAVFEHRRDAYTAEEREMGIEKVNTGLMKPMKMSADDESSESDEDEDEEMDDVKTESATEKKVQGPARSLDEIVRFMTIGLAPEDEPQMGGMAFRR